MNRNLATLLIIWLVLSVVGVLWVSGASIFPAAAAAEAVIVDDAFRLLLILAVPVAALVLTVLGYSLLRFRVDGNDDEDGPPMATHRPLAVGWFVITTALVIFVAFDPGLKGLNQLEAAATEEPLVIQVEAEQWHWNVTYPAYDLSYERALQIALPVHQPVRFEITSRDVIHSLWIPAFRQKLDALPGKTTTLNITPEEIGSFESEPTLRVQCAELCGTGHTRMQMGVRVLETAAFDAWIDATKAVVESGSMEMDMDMDMGGEGQMDMDAGNGEMQMDMDAGEGEMEMDSSNMDMDQ